MAGPPFAVKIDGVRRLTRAIAAVSPELRKGLGRANKTIGQRVIDKASPKPLNVGEGRGAKPRASANANVLQIMAGGRWRDGKNFHRLQWGPRFEPRDDSRPYIALAGEKDMPQIERDYLAALKSAASKAGIKFRTIR